MIWKNTNEAETLQEDSDVIAFDAPGLSLKFSSTGQTAGKHPYGCAVVNLHKDYISLQIAMSGQTLFPPPPAHARHHIVDFKKKWELFSIIIIFMDSLNYTQMGQRLLTWLGAQDLEVWTSYFILNMDIIHIIWMCKYIHHPKYGHQKLTSCIHMKLQTQANWWQNQHWANSLDRWTVFFDFSLGRVTARLLTTTRYQKLQTSFGQSVA